MPANGDGKGGEDGGPALPPWHQRPCGPAAPDVLVALAVELPKDFAKCLLQWRGLCQPP